MMKHEERVTNLDCPLCETTVDYGYHHPDENLFSCIACVDKMSRLLKLPTEQWERLHPADIARWWMGHANSDPENSWAPCLIKTKFMLDAFTPSKYPKKRKKRTRSKSTGNKKKKSSSIPTTQQPLQTGSPPTVPQMIQQDLLLLGQEMKEQRDIIMNILNIVMDITKQLAQQRK